MTLVATAALCADRAAISAPAVRAHEHQPTADPIARLASHLGSKLTGAFRRVVTETRLSPVRRDGVAAAPSPLARSAVAVPATIHVVETSPFRFRLPPPNA